MGKYHVTNYEQLSFDDFNQPTGLPINQNNRWVVRADNMPWHDLEKQYAMVFKSKCGPKPLPFRLVFGALMIQQLLELTDEETLEQIKENPYLQYFVGQSGYVYERPLSSSTLSRARQRIGDAEVLAMVNEMEALMAQKGINSKIGRQH
ncbi:transposase [Weissella hellenica]|uniref:transposase n=1 Tax=Weissella hellenica TaxID=46256 RepID=UPI0038874E18